MTNRFDVITEHYKTKKMFTIHRPFSYILKPTFSPIFSPIHIRLRNSLPLLSSESIGFRPVHDYSIVFIVWNLRVIDVDWGFANYPEHRRYIGDIKIPRPKNELQVLSNFKVILIILFDLFNNWYTKNMTHKVKSLPMSARRLSRCYVV